MSRTLEDFSLTSQASRNVVQIIPVTGDDLEDALKQQDKAAQNYIRNTGFNATPGATEYVRDMHGTPTHVFVGITSYDDLWALAGLPKDLQDGYDYQLPANFPQKAAQQMSLGWALGTYQYDALKSEAEENPNAPALVLHPTVDARDLITEADATCYVRDLINAPANIMDPQELENEVLALANEFNAASNVIRGDDLLAQNFPLIHLVGRAAEKEPRYVEFSWGKPTDRKVTLVGKGVTYDTGGLSIKPTKGMRTMKKDMGGAAHVLGLAKMIMSEDLPVRLRVIIPIVENAIANNAMRVGDVVPTRSGKTMEIGHADAEGRIILSDALYEASSDKPDLLIDFATLTGAARSSLGNYNALFCNSDGLAEELTALSGGVQDKTWRLPLDETLEEDLTGGTVADLWSDPDNGKPDHILAALLLKQFIANDHTEWAHFDISAWNNGSQPGRPKGGEATGMRTAFAYIRKHYSARPA